MTATTTTTATSTTSIAGLEGRILDLDSHLQLKAGTLREIFGDNLAGGAADVFEEFENAGVEMRALEHDLMEFELVKSGSDDHRPLAERVWRVKGPFAPGADTPEGRLESLDLMGIDRQLIFPMVAVAIAAWLRGKPDAPDVMRAYNDYVLDWTRAGNGRLRPTAILNTDTIQGAMAEARRVIDGGCRAVLIQGGQAPAGISPAAPEWDPFWATLAEARVPVLLHIGGELYSGQQRWRPQSLTPRHQPGGGELVGPFELATIHLAAQMYVSTMVLGGVFERHPDLAMGAIELGAQWVGPMAEMLDQRCAIFERRMGEHLSLKPSEYLRRQFRATPFWWEPTDVYIERYGIPEVYAFSTDFPHPEGGEAPIQAMHERLARLGDDVVEKYFVTNGSLILPA